MPAMKLTIADIADIRAYERERDEFRRRIIALKKRRRVGVGPFVTFVFENRDTIRFQIQEMARVERIFSDEGIQAELDTYNPMIPEPGTLRATMFIELTNSDDLRNWLPRLVGIERSVELRLPGGTVLPATVDEAHAEQLTRDSITASVHYLGFELTEAAIDEFASGGAVMLALAHPNYAYATQLDDGARSELVSDLRST